MPSQNRLLIVTHNRLLIVTHESIGSKMAGPGIRAWELACALGRSGVPVTLASPKIKDRTSTDINLRQFSWEQPQSLRSLIDDAQVVLAAGPLVTRLLHFLDGPIQKPVIVDLYDVAEIERMMLQCSVPAQTGTAQRKAVFYTGDDLTPVILDEMLMYLHQGDFFICASAEQHDYWLGALMAAGRINLQTQGPDFTVQGLLDLVPFGIPDTPPRLDAARIKGVVPAIGPDDRVVFWGGGLWDWTDPFTLLDAMRVIWQTRPDVRLVFGARAHFDSQIVPELSTAPMSVASQLVEKLQQEGLIGQKVFFLDWIPYDERGAYLLEADVSVGLFKRTIENRYAIRSRLFDCLWAACPSVISGGDYLSKRMAEVGLAQVVEPGNVHQVSQGIQKMLETPFDRPAFLAKNSHLLADMTWSVMVQPIRRFMEQPHFAPDAEAARSNLNVTIPLRRAWDALKTERDELAFTLAQQTADFERFRNRRLIRYTDRILGFLLRKRANEVRPPPKA